MMAESSPTDAHLTFSGEFGTSGEAGYSWKLNAWRDETQREMGAFEVFDVVQYVRQHADVIWGVNTKCTGKAIISLITNEKRYIFYYLYIDIATL